MKIHWIWILVVAVLFEAALFAITAVLSLFMTTETILPAVPVMVFVVGIPFGMWIARKAAAGAVLHGALVGVVATLIYLGLILGQFGSLTPVIEMYGPVAFYSANALKILGCIAGAYAAARRRSDHRLASGSVR